MKKMEEQTLWKNEEKNEKSAIIPRIFQTNSNRTKCWKEVNEKENLNEMHTGRIKYY